MELSFLTSLPEAAKAPAGALAEEHRLLRFWRAAYAPYERPLNHGFGFHVPQFPGPLHSPNFVLGGRARFLAANRGLISHFNEIVPLGHDQRGPAPVGYRLAKQVFLGRKRVAARALPPGFALELLSLHAAIRISELWILLTDGFPREAPFLRAQLPFLCTLPAEFRAAFLKDQNGRRVGVVLLGIAGGAALVLNATVPLGERSRSLGRVLGEAAESLAFQLGAEEAFFLFDGTEHAFLGRHASVVEHYRVFERA